MKNKILSTKLLDRQIAIFYTGQMGFLVKYGETFLLFDGYFTDYVDRNGHDARWVRRYPAPLTPDDLDFVDYAFFSHDHSDHTDPWTVAGLAKVNDHVVCIAPPPAADTLADCGIPSKRIRRVETDKPFSLPGPIQVTAFPAAHEELHPDGCGSYAEVGYRLTLGDIVLCHTGDCCPYEGLAERLAGNDILILPINGRDYYRTREQNIIGCFDSREALLLAKTTGTKLLIPGHFDLYDANGVNPAYFVDCQQKFSAEQAYHIFMPGERYIYEA